MSTYAESYVIHISTYANVFLSSATIINVLAMHQYIHLF